MKTLRDHIRDDRWPSRLVAALALILCVSQWSAIAHAASYGFDEHDHDGVACEVSIVNEKLDDLMPAASLDVLAPVVLASTPATESKFDVSCTTLAARPRAPPTHA